MTIFASILIARTVGLTLYQSLKIALLNFYVFNLFLTISVDSFLFSYIKLMNLKMFCRWARIFTQRSWIWGIFWFQTWYVNAEITNKKSISGLCSKQYCVFKDCVFNPTMERTLRYLRSMPVMAKMPLKVCRLRWPLTYVQYKFIL